MTKFETPIARVMPARLAALSARMLSAIGTSGIGPMDEEKVDRVDPQPLQAVLDRTLQRPVADELRPHLGGDEDLFARHA